MANQLNMQKIMVSIFLNMKATSLTHTVIDPFLIVDALTLT